MGATVKPMWSTASQLESLRKQHQSALLDYNFQHAELLNQRIRELQTQVSTDNWTSNRRLATQTLEHHRTLITTQSSEYDQALAQQKAAIANRFRIQRSAIDQLFAQENDRLRAQYDLDVERSTSRAIPDVASLLREARVLGSNHDYEQAREVHEQAMKLRDSINEERRFGSAVLFVKRQRELRERRARQLKAVDEREEALMRGLEHRTDQVHAIVLNRMKVKDSKAEKALKDVDRWTRSGGSLGSIGSPRRSPLRSRSFSSLQFRSNLSW
jgi:SHS2 domain-containing protein